jgi:hypothetical protein
MCQCLTTKVTGKKSFESKCTLCNVFYAFYSRIQRSKPPWIRVPYKSNIPSCAFANVQTSFSDADQVPDESDCRKAASVVDQAPLFQDLV